MYLHDITCYLFVDINISARYSIEYIVTIDRNYCLDMIIKYMIKFVSNIVKIITLWDITNVLVVLEFIKLVDVEVIL